LKERPAVPVLGPGSGEHSPILIPSTSSWPHPSALRPTPSPSAQIFVPSRARAPRSTYLAGLGGGSKLGLTGGLVGPALLEKSFRLSATNSPNSNSISKLQTPVPPPTPTTCRTESILSVVQTFVVVGSLLTLRDSDVDNGGDGGGDHFDDLRVREQNAGRHQVEKTSRSRQTASPAQCIPPRQDTPHAPPTPANRLPGWLAPTPLGQPGLDSSNCLTNKFCFRFPSSLENGEMAIFPVWRGFQLVSVAWCACNSPRS
jgi:hypothetical protein